MAVIQDCEYRCVCCISLSWAALTRAEEPAEEPVEVEHVVVSATKTPLPASQVTSAVEVITGEEMQQKKLKTVVDVLRLAPGLAVFQSGRFGTEASVRIRGAQPRHTLVLVDGTIVNSPATGAYDFATLTAENIDRIEILRGAQSMLWSRTPSAASSIFTPSEAPARRPPGSFGVVNASVSYDMTTRMQIYGRVDNLLNQKYEEILFFGTPIRSVYGGIKVTL